MPKRPPTKYECSVCGSGPFTWSDLDMHKFDGTCPGVKDTSDKAKSSEAGSGPQESVGGVGESVRFRGSRWRAAFVIAEFTALSTLNWDEFFASVLSERGGREFYVDVSIENAGSALQTMRLTILDEL